MSPRIDGTESEQRVGVVGLGVMGSRLVGNLRRQGMEVLVWDRASEPILAWEKRGAIASASVRELTSRANVLFLVLPDGPEVESVLLDDAEILDRAPADAVIVVCSTISVDVTRRIAKAVEAGGRAFLEAPIGDAMDLFFMVGGPTEVFRRVESVLRAASDAEPVYCGGVGAGMVTKLVNNLLALSIFAATAEAIVLGTRAGVEADVLHEVFERTGAQNVQHRTMDHEPSRDAIFRLGLAHKDAVLAHELAQAVGVSLSALDPAKDLLEAGVAEGDQAGDYRAVRHVIERGATQE